jgi:hypothetical protein
MAPGSKKASFYVADRIGGFHPKAIFWIDRNGRHHMIAGSSNLTEAAFSTNFEANLYSRINAREYEQMTEWLELIIDRSRPVDRKWLASYQEAELRGKRIFGPHRSEQDSPEYHHLSLTGDNVANVLMKRRQQVKEFEKIRSRLAEVFEKGAVGKISCDEVCRKLLEMWRFPEIRFQAPGWERRGVRSNWRLFSTGLSAVLSAKKDERDSIVGASIDEFAKEGLATRKALFSEMLCQFFPDQYPVLNSPIRRWIRIMKFRPARGATEGAAFVDLAQKMRSLLARGEIKVRGTRVKNLAELDSVVWASFHNS